MRQVAIGHQHLELRIKGQERLQQILLGPKAKFLHHPIAPVLERQKDIVDVHDDAWLETRQDFQEEIIDVSANFHRMRTVDKKNVAGVELREEFEVDVLDLFLDQTAQSGKSLFRETLEEMARCRSEPSCCFLQQPGPKAEKKTRCRLR